MIARETLGRTRIEVETHGTVRFDRQPSNGLHRHDYVEACVVLGGTGRYRHGSGEYPLREGDVFVADPGVLHEISSHGARDLYLWFLTWDCRRLDEGPPTPEDDLLERYLRRHRTHASGADALARYLPLIDERAEGVARSAAKMAVRYLALEMMETLADAPKLGEAESAVDPVDLALAYLDARADRTVGVGEVAAAVGLSARALRRRFTAHLGVGPAEEANHRRMRRAAHFLLMGFSAAEAGRRVGIDAPAQFTRAFRRAMGVAPKTFQSDYAPGRTTRP